MPKTISRPPTTYGFKKPMSSLPTIPAKNPEFIKSNTTNTLDVFIFKVFTLTDANLVLKTKSVLQYFFKIKYYLFRRYQLMGSIFAF